VQLPHALWKRAWWLVQAHTVRVHLHDACVSYCVAWKSTLWFAQEHTEAITFASCECDCLCMHALEQIDIIAEKATQKVKQRCWSGHAHNILCMQITCLEL